MDAEELIRAAQGAFERAIAAIREERDAQERRHVEERAAIRETLRQTREENDALKERIKQLTSSEDEETGE